MRAADDISSWRGGASNDSIRVHAGNATIDAGAGEGDDVVSTYGHSTVSAGDSVDFSISGYSQDDVIVTQQHGRTTVKFKGSDDALVFNLGGNGSARPSFADHASVDIRA